MRITLAKIDDHNQAECESLQVSKEQSRYIASNADSLKDAAENAEVARPFAIYSDDRMVGFTMFAFDENNEDPGDRYWLWRFMIDASQQGKGYGNAALREIIRYFKEHGADQITLSTKESNATALGLYHKYGFKENGDMNDGEIVLKLQLMNLPKMILFDYGHTLLYENNHDVERGNRAIYQCITKNPKNISFEEFNKVIIDTFAKIRECRNGIDINEDDFLRLCLDYMGVELSVSLKEAERLNWNGISEGAIMPKADKMIDYLNENNIRMGVISNLCWSGKALRERLDRLLPRNRFEFVIASCEYIVKKPDRMLFEIALNKAGLSADEVWYCGDLIEADVYGAHGAGIFPVLYEGVTDEANPFAGQNDGYEIDFEHMRIKDWDELIQALEEKRNTEALAELSKRLSE